MSEKDNANEITREVMSWFQKPNWITFRASTHQTKDTHENRPIVRNTVFKHKNIKLTDDKIKK